ncbi:MAG: UDP-N-acetylmuramoyl-L-alanyl-D-glutamate--2,6-diaminopimelate ligase [Oscillospiraceae bacterium]|nr:UDP-N-acetylmuramoyl-L-alanyl-D-glutamate--2,6-diaminopimelate ligase [Oscillospiraceae bacterium]
MKLRDLLKNIGVLECTADPELDIENIYYDSRKVTAGSLFVAISGFASDGNRFIPMAMEKGAAVVVTAKKPDVDVPYVLVESDRMALAMLGCNFYGHPAKSMTMIGVTGTNGKTSTTLLLKQVLETCLGAKVGLIGTMANMVGDEIIPTERTTPESFELQGLFARMRDAGCTHVVMEVSSHAISLDRIGGVHFDIAAFTNLTEDHLDFHKTMDAYCDAKAELFRRCDKAVVNRDDSYSGRILDTAACPVLTTSVVEEAGLYAKDLELLSEGIRFTAVSGEETADVHVPIPGKFTVYNTLTVMGIAKQLGISLADCAAALAKVQGVKGRVEVVPTPETPYSVLIDYAHTPDGLENVLSSVKDFCKGRLISVFGCGGDRDPMKRPIMGEIGVKLSDIAIITSDNPRTEDPMAIIEDILKGVKQEYGEYIVMEDRRAAIRYAMDIAEKDDIIVLAGKGHETYQEINGHKYHLDERDEVAAHLQESRNQNG